MTDDLRRGRLAHDNQIVERDHGAGIGADIVLADVLGVGAELFVGLHIHTIGTVIEIEIVDVGRAHVDAESVGDLTERDVQALGFFAIDGDDILRIACRVGGEQSGEVLFFALAAGASQVVGDFVEILKSVVALIQEFELESAELA